MSSVVGEGAPSVQMFVITAYWDFVVPVFAVFAGAKTNGVIQKIIQIPFFNAGSCFFTPLSNNVDRTTGSTNVHLKFGL